MAEHLLYRYDQDVVKNLMPLIVNVLESLDLAYTESSEFEVQVFPTHSTYSEPSEFEEIQMLCEYFSEAFRSRRSVLYLIEICPRGPDAIDKNPFTAKNFNS